ncbi:MAG: LysR family transcriptional regulator [Cyanobium sp.]
MLNLDQIHTFLAVAKLLHFSKAADDLHLSQSAVSATIGRLEQEVGVPLFHRIGRRVELTDAGRFLQREGLALVEQSIRLRRELEDFNALQKGSLLLGASFTVGNYWLPRFLARFRNRYPGIELSCNLANAEKILDGIDSGQFDLGFVCGCSPPSAASVVGEERLTLVVGRDHPWYGEPMRPAQSLLQAQWLLREQGSGSRQMLEQSLTDLGLDAKALSIHQVLHSSEMLKTMVLSGTGLAALPVSMVEQEIKLGLLWTVEVHGHHLRAEAIWMVPCARRQDSQLIKRFQALILAGDIGI